MTSIDYNEKKNGFAGEKKIPMPVIDEAWVAEVIPVQRKYAYMTLYYMELEYSLSAGNFVLIVLN